VVRHRAAERVDPLHDGSVSAPLVLTPGDPHGIGPEVAVRALVAAPPQRRVVLLGDRAALERVRPPGLGVQWCTSADQALRCSHAISAFDPGDSPDPVEVASVALAVEACLAGSAAALVTGPIHKARLAARGFPHPGHTELLGALCGIDHPVMAFVGGRLRVALVTVHLPLAQVAQAISAERVERVIRTAERGLREQFGVVRPRLLVCGLNPHAGDGGLLGREEIVSIAPAIARCVQSGLSVEGPVSAEAAFRRALAEPFDMVVAMYHDQGLAPLKLIDFGQSVNVTLGLPIVRTSVDHGTADDLVGTGRADPASMIAALRVAQEMVGPG